MNIKFKNASIKVKPSVYEPSEDSFLMAETALSEIKGTENILEVGCGSGMISAVIKKNTKAKIVGIDINPNAAACSRENGIEVIVGDLLSCIKGKFDIIIFNPPYLPADETEISGYDETSKKVDKGKTKDWIKVAIDGGYDGREIINRFLDDAGMHLVDKGRILMLVSSLTGIEEVKSKMKSLNYAVEEKSHERFMFEQLSAIVATKLDMSVPTPFPHS